MKNNAIYTVLFCTSFLIACASNFMDDNMEEVDPTGNAQITWVNAPPAEITVGANVSASWSVSSDNPVKISGLIICETGTEN